MTHQKVNITIGLSSVLNFGLGILAWLHTSPQVVISMIFRVFSILFITIGMLGVLVLGFMLAPGEKASKEDALS